MDRRQIGCLIGAVVLLVWASVTLAETVSEEAQRYMAQGVAAVEMAKSSADYEDAISKFEKAKSLAPDWPDVYYNLGLVQEKAGKYGDAVVNLKKYLRLAPNSKETAQVKSLINKLEYKAEQVLTVPEIIDVLVSDFQYSKEWKYSSTVKTGNRECRRNYEEIFFQSEGSDTVRALKSEQNHKQFIRQHFQVLKVTGSVLKYTTTINVCGSSANKESEVCDSVIENEVEVVSKNLIKINQKVIRGGAGAGVVTGDRYSCNFQLSEK